MFTYLNFSYYKITKSHVFSILELINFLEETANKNKNRNIALIKSAIKILEEENYICNINTDKPKLNEFISCKICDNFDKNKFGENQFFYKFSYDNFIKIKNIKTTCKKRHLFIVYSYMLARCGNKYSETIVSGGRANVFWESLGSISLSLNMAKNTLNNCINELQKANMLWFESIGNVKKNGKIQKAVTTFTVFGEQELQEGLNQSVNYYENLGYEVTTDNKINKLKGKKGSIQKKINNGTVSLEELQELNKLNKIFNQRNKKVKIRTDERKIININTKRPTFISNTVDYNLNKMKF